MKLKGGFILKNVAGTNVVVPVGTNTVTFKAIITLNDTGAFLWQQLEKGCTKDDLLELMVKEYSVDRSTAAADISEFIDNLKKAELLE